MESVNSVLKYVALAIVGFVIFLFYIRPEHTISAEKFINFMQQRSYKVYYAQNVKNADVSYVAIDINKIKIYYIHFKNEEDCKNYYADLVKDSEGKHLLNVVRDQRLQKVAQEKLTYLDDDTFYSFLYTKDAVMYGKTHAGNKGELLDIFGTLAKPEPLSFNDLMAYYQNYFMNLMGDKPKVIQ